MKKSILLATTLFGLSFAAHASGTINIVGDPYVVDTLFHNQIGPGTTQTSLWLHNGSVNLRAFYTTIDLTNPYISLECIIGRDHMPQAQTLESMSRHHTSEGHQAFVGINGDFWINTGDKTIRGESMYGAPSGTTICDGNVMITRPNPGNYISFVADDAGQLFMNALEYRGTLTTTTGSTMTVSAINPARITPVNNTVTIYNSYYFSSTNVTGGVEVTARLADGETFNAVGHNTFIITSDPDTQGDMLIPEGGFVLHARGTNAEAFINSLKSGDQITLDSQCTMGGVDVNPMQAVSGFPRILGGGEVLDTEGQRGDADQRHPRTGIGYSADGKTAYFCVVDGRQSLSAGIRTMGLACIMQYAGAAEAMNLDGGGSSTLYSDQLGEINNPSEGRLRAVANAMFAVSSAPTDNDIAELRFLDYKLSTPRYGTYVPHFYGYNQYGVLIDTDVKGVKLSCPEGFGTIEGDSLFFASGTGTDLLTATLGDVSVSMPMTIVGAELDNMEIVHHSIVTDGLRDYTVEVQTMLDGAAMPLNAAALTWTSSDNSVVTVGEHTGTLRGLKDGTATITGTVDGISDTILVTVECPTARVMTADDLDASTWNITMRAGKDGSATQLDNGGFRWNYTGSTGRLPRILLEKQIKLWSLPDTLRLRVNTGNTPLKQVLFSLYPGTGKLTSATVVPDSVPTNAELVFDLATAHWTSPEDMGSYPITLSAIQMDLNSMTNGQAYQIDFLGLETVYARVADAPEQVVGDVDGNGVVDVDDLNIIINIMVGKNSNPDFVAPADIDGNGTVDVDDLNRLINIMLHRA